MGPKHGTFTISGAFPEIASEAKDLTSRLMTAPCSSPRNNWNYGRELWKTRRHRCRYRDGQRHQYCRRLGRTRGRQPLRPDQRERDACSSPRMTETVDALWKSDGTEAGTVMVTRFSTFTENYYLTAANGTVFFRASDGVHGYELWKSDGTEAGTLMVKDITTGSSSTSFSQMTAVNGTLFFRADDGIHGSELWKSDGTEAGTVMVKDITSGSASTSLNSFTNVNGSLFFTANDGVHGTELWKSDGTEAGTVMVKDIALDSASEAIPRDSPTSTVLCSSLRMTASTDTSSGRVTGLKTAP